MTDVPELLHRYWGIRPADVIPLEGGMNSQTWKVEHGGSTYVAKRVLKSQTADLIEGCDAALALAEAGLVTGRPVRTLDGRLVVSEHGLALLAHVPGRELEGETDEEQRWIASTLARVHSACEPVDGPSPATFARDWLPDPRRGVDVQPWLDAAVEEVRAETGSLTLTWSLLHTDPAPEAFIHDESSGVTGLIDWAGARRGPVLYDVASAVMYLGGPKLATAFLATYRAEGPLRTEEMRHLDAFRRSGGWCRRRTSRIGWQSAT